MRIMQLLTNSFDRLNTFNVMIPGFSRSTPRRCSLPRDYKEIGDGVLWIMQHAGVIASSYSPYEIAERDRLNSEPPVVDGEVVEFEGKEYRVRVVGDYSDCAFLDPVVDDRPKTLDPATGKWVPYDPATGAYL